MMTTTTTWLARGSTLSGMFRSGKQGQLRSLFKSYEGKIAQMIKWLDLAAATTTTTQSTLIPIGTVSTGWIDGEIHGRLYSSVTTVRVEYWTWYWRWRGCFRVTQCVHGVPGRHGGYIKGRRQVAIDCDVAVDIILSEIGCVRHGLPTMRNDDFPVV